MSVQVQAATRGHTAVRVAGKSILPLLLAASVLAPQAANAADPLNFSFFAKGAPGNPLYNFNQADLGVGRTQVIEATSDKLTIFNKTDGSVLSTISGANFWQGATGGAGFSANSYAQVNYVSSVDRWVAVATSDDGKSLGIAVSNSGDATAGWKTAVLAPSSSTLFDQGFLTVDDTYAYYGASTIKQSGSSYVLTGSQIQIVPLADLAKDSGPDLSGRSTITNGLKGQYMPIVATNADGGASTTVMGQGQFDGFRITKLENLSTTPTTSLVKDVIVSTGATSVLVPQGISVASKPKIVGPGMVVSDTYEYNGKIYFVYSSSPTKGYVELYVDAIDKNTGAFVDAKRLNTLGMSEFSGGIAVNSYGQLVVAYNKSSNLIGDQGKISLWAQSFNIQDDGKILADSDPTLLAQSSYYFSPYINPTYWDAYTNVVVDPTDPSTFWVSGDYVSGTTETRGYIASVHLAQVQTPGAVPEPATWALMLGGFGFVGATLRRRRYALQRI